MRKHLLLPVFLLLVLPAFAQSKSKPVAAKPVTYDLADAIAKKLVALDIRGTGGHQGECLKVVCRNLRGQMLRLRIPQGQLLEPVDSSMQTLVVVEGRELMVTAKSPAEVLLSTFCTQAGDRSPTAGSPFALGALAAENLRALLQFIVEKGKAGDGDAQNAVWCITNQSPIGSIADPALANFTAKLLNKKLPGYTIKYHNTVTQPGERAGLGPALVVEGNYQFVLARDEKISLVLYDAAGKQVKVLRKDELMKAGEHRSSLRLQVYNLTPGRYFVRLEKPDKEMIKEIEVEF
ncbi:MAG: T9SS type A sorting domain-containing protein [Saprospiraceae bacterium]